MFSSNYGPLLHHCCICMAKAFPVSILIQQRVQCGGCTDTQEQAVSVHLLDLSGNIPKAAVLRDVQTFVIQLKL